MVKPGQETSFDINQIEHLLTEINGGFLDHAKMPAIEAARLALTGYVEEANILKDAALDIEKALPETK